MDYHLQGRNAFIIGGAEGMSGERFEGSGELLVKKETNETQHSHPFGYQESIDGDLGLNRKGSLA